MVKKIKEYEEFLKNLLESQREITRDDLFSIKAHISFFQHERLVHELIVILFALLAIALFLVSLFIPEVAIFMLDFCFFILLVPYIFHYFGLENGVQRLYLLYTQIEKQRGKCSKLE